MTSLERVRRTLRHEETDRVPRLLYGEAIGYVPTIEALLKERCAPQLPREYFEMDITGVVPSPANRDRSRFAEWHGAEFPGADAAGEIDEWGVRWKQGNYFHFAHIESPLREIDAMEGLKRYPWPDLDDPARYQAMAAEVATRHDEGFATCAFAGSVFEQAWYLRGLEPLMMDMLSEPEMAHCILERTSYFQRCAAVQMARAGIDIIILGDDVAGQQGLLMGKEVWAEFLRDRLAATCRAVHETSDQARVFYHSDGNIVPLIPELIECGVDILNPLQPECLDPAAVKREFGERLCFWGAVSVQRTMPFGSPDEVRAEVRERVRTLGAGGGYILAPAHVLGPETRWENIVAFFDAANEPLPARGKSTR